MIKMHMAFHNLELEGFAWINNVSQPDNVLQTLD